LTEYHSKKAVSPCTLALALCFIAQPAAMSLPPQPAVLLKEHSQMYDDVDILVAPNGFSMTFRKSKMALYMHAPAWQIVYANLAEKVYYTCPIEKWKGNPSVFSALVRPSSPTSLRLTTAKKTNHKGLECTVHKMENKEASRGSERTWKRLLPKDGEIWLYQKEKFPPLVYQTVANLLALPPGPGIPVAMNYRRMDNKPIHELLFYGFKKCSAGDEDLAPPKGFKRVYSQHAVLNKIVESKDFADFLDENRAPK